MKPTLCFKLVLLVMFCSTSLQIDGRRDNSTLLNGPFDNMNVKLNSVGVEYISSSSSNNISNNCVIGSPADVHFYLYTDKNPSSGYEIFVGDRETLTASPFNIGEHLKILIHGFGGSYQSSYPTRLKNAYLNTTTNINVVTVDWGILAEPPLYDRAILNTAVVGNRTAELVLFLISQNATSMDQLHIIGHSLGAHVSGIIGHQINKSIGGMVPRISGLDPAKPLYELAGLERRLDVSDAHFVDVIHTSILGLYRTVGHVDFYPNKGTIQPECLPVDLACNHGQAHELFTESVYNPSRFRACKCSVDLLGFPIILPKSCRCNGTDPSTIGFMGNGVSISTTGAFYLRTNKNKRKL